MSYTELVVQNAVTGLLEPCDGKQRKNCLSITQLGSVAPIHQESLIFQNIFHAIEWMTKYSLPLHQKYWDILADFCLTFLTEMNVFPQIKTVAVLLKKRKINWNVSTVRASSSFFARPWELWQIPWDPLCPLHHLWARIWAEFPLAIALLWLSQPLSFWWKYTCLIWIASLTFGNIYIFSPAWAKNVAKHLKQILW